jgi:hypothetical protein
MGELTVQASLTRGLRLFSSQTAGPRVTDIQPAVHDNGNLIGGSQRCASLPRRPSKLPETHFQRSLTT